MRAHWMMAASLFASACATTVPVSRPGQPPVLERRIDVGKTVAWVLLGVAATSAGLLIATHSGHDGDRGGDGDVSIDPDEAAAIIGIISIGAGAR